MGNKVLFIIFVIMGLSLFFVIKKNRDLSIDIDNIRPDTVIYEFRDTIFDTVFIPKPYPVAVIEKKYIPLPCDSDSIRIPIHQYQYQKDSVFDLWVSGFKIELDSIKIYQRIITNNVYTKIDVPIPYKRKGIWIRLEGDDNYFGIGSIKR